MVSDHQVLSMAEIKVEYVDHMGDDLRIVNAARISMGKQSGELNDRDKKLINYLAINQHMTPFEHCVLSVIIRCPLYIRSQIHRHRTIVFNEVSRRYTSENIEFYLPRTDDIRKQSKSNKQTSDGTLSTEVATNAQQVMQALAAQSEEVFNKLLEMGVAREQARAVLPQSLMTKFYATANLRNWCHFLKLRLDAHAQKEVQMVAVQVAEIIKECFPASYAALMNE